MLLFTVSMMGVVVRFAVLGCVCVVQSCLALIVWKLLFGSYADDE